MKEHHSFYAGVHEPRELRRDTLLAQKSIIDSLKKFEQLRAIRSEKELRMLELKKILNVLRVIAGGLKSKLPATAMKFKPQPVMSAPKSAAPARTARAKPAVVHKTKLQLLEEELSKIESKLSSID
jgi:hypothetical protein